MTVSEYIEEYRKRMEYPGRITKSGQLKILFEGKWISEEAFDQLVPRVVVIDFDADMTNVDTTKKWMHQ